MSFIIARWSAGGGWFTIGGMAFRRYGSFTGGIDLPDEKQATLAAPIGEWLIPERLAVPLAPCGAAAEPVVSVGGRVAAGELLARAGAESAVDIYAPLSGTVRALTTVRVASRDRFIESPAVELVDLAEPAGGDDEKLPAEGSFDWATAGAEDLLRRIAGGALTTYRRRPTPLALWIGRARSRSCRTVIANVLEQEPYVSSNHRLLAQHGEEVVEGLAIVARAIGADRVVLAADRRWLQHYEGSVDAAERLGIWRIALPHKYPMGAETILTKVLVRRETPPGGSTLEVGSAVIGASACVAAYRWVVGGLRPRGRVVTLAGPRAAKPANRWAPFGADCLALADAAGARVIHGGPMTGIVCPPEAVVTPATDAVLAFDPADPPPPSPCIRCGWCTDHCPARLNVAALNDTFELSLLEEARRQGATACVECGVCSYVCPARLPLTQRVKQLKQRIFVAGRAAAVVGEGTVT